MDHITNFLIFVCLIATSLGEFEPSFPNISHYACDSKCISKFSEDLTNCQSDTGMTSDCQLNQLGEQLPNDVCTFSAAVNSSAEQINELFNKGRFAAYKWNIIRESFTKGPLSMNYISEEEEGTVSNIEVLADTESTKFTCQYNFEVRQETSKSAEVPFYTVMDGNSTEWHWGWLFHSENVHIFLSCQASQGHSNSSKSFGSVVIYIREGHEEEGDDACKSIQSLRSVQFDDTIVQCI